MKLFLWETPDGVFFAMAHNVTEARRLIQEDGENWPEDLELLNSYLFLREPVVINEPKGIKHWDTSRKVAHER